MDRDITIYIPCTVLIFVCIGLVKAKFACNERFGDRVCVFVTVYIYMYARGEEDSVQVHAYV